MLQSGIHDAPHFMFTKLHYLLYLPLTGFREYTGACFCTGFANTFTWETIEPVKTVFPLYQEEAIHHGEFKFKNHVGLKGIDDF